jgi:hypothetical protein
MLSGLLAHTLRFSPKNTTSLLSISSRVPLQCHRAPHQLLRLRQTPPNRTPISTLSRTRLHFSRLFSGSPTGPTVPPTGKSVLKQPLPPRFFSSNGGAHWQPDAQPLPVLSTPAVANWLLLSSTLVFAVIVVGGVTRLTESGLSITEWRPITGVLPPLSLAEWENEFERYKATPEFHLCVALRCVSLYPSFSDYSLTCLDSTIRFYLPQSFPSGLTRAYHSMTSSQSTTWNGPTASSGAPSVSPSSSH